MKLIQQQRINLVFRDDIFSKYLLNFCFFGLTDITSNDGRLTVVNPSINTNEEDIGINFNLLNVTILC